MIDSTMNVDDIAETLHENGIIEMPWLFKTYINMNDEAEGFLDGEYTVNSTMSYSNIITLLKTVRQYTNTVTVMIPEGYNAQQIGQLLEENLVCRADDFEKYYRSKLENTTLRSRSPLLKIASTLWRATFSQIPTSSMLSTISRISPVWTQASTQNRRLKRCIPISRIR